MDLAEATYVDPQAGRNHTLGGLAALWPGSHSLSAKIDLTMVERPAQGASQVGGRTALENAARRFMSSWAVGGLIASSGHWGTSRALGPARTVVLPIYAGHPQWFEEGYGQR